MKKIKISTVKMQCDAQVINIDAHLVANAVKAQLLMMPFVAALVEEENLAPQEVKDEYNLPDKYLELDINKLEGPTGNTHSLADNIVFINEFLTGLTNAFLEDNDDTERK